jgi:hypothetical protein
VARNDSFHARRAPQEDGRRGGRRRRTDALGDRARGRVAPYHTFDTATPTGSGYDTNGAPAPSRDGLRGISDLYDLFRFDGGRHRG